MTTQQAVSNMCGNTFGKGADIGINVSTTTTKENGETVRKSRSCIHIKQEPVSDEKHPSLENWLKDIHLSKILNNLIELGAEEVEDVLDLDDEDIAGLQLKKLQTKRFQRAITKLKENPSS
tara:strand:- start:1650 stop:2012 length:363 start_codon:yes stop_codon:yes gene_type:complete